MSGDLTAPQRELRERLLDECRAPVVATVALIDLAVQLAEEVYGDRIDDILAEVGERAERDAYEGD